MATNRDARLIEVRLRLACAELERLEAERNRMVHSHVVDPADLDLLERQRLQLRREMDALWTESLKVQRLVSAPVPTQMKDRPLPKGALIDWLTPPEHAEHRVHALLVAYETRWIPKYGRWARLLFLVQSIGVVVGFWINWLLKRTRLLNLLQS